MIKEIIAQKNEKAIQKQKEQYEMQEAEREQILKHIENCIIRILKKSPDEWFDGVDCIHPTLYIELQPYKHINGLYNYGVYLGVPTAVGSFVVNATRQMRFFDNFQLSYPNFDFHDLFKSEKPKIEKIRNFTIIKFN